MVSATLGRRRRSTSDALVVTVAGALLGDREPDGKATDVVGLCLAPPDDAIVPCVGEKSQIRALDRSAPMRPVQPGLPERRTHGCNLRP